MWRRRRSMGCARTTSQLGTRLTEHGKNSLRLNVKGSPPALLRTRRGPMPADKPRWSEWWTLAVFVVWFAAAVVWALVARR
jgi:hypothetical protein